MSLTERLTLYHEVLDEEGAIIEQNPVVCAEGVESIRFLLHKDGTSGVEFVPSPPPRTLRRHAASMLPWR